MNNRTIIAFLVALVVILLIALLWTGELGGSSQTATTTSATTTDLSVDSIKSFEDCSAAGYPVTGTSPRQCRLPDGRVYAEEVAVNPTYTNATSDQIQITNPTAGAVVGKTITVTGKARGSWYFEASFPVEVLDKDGNVLAQKPAQAQGDWMTTEFVPYSVTLTVPQSYIGPATLVLKKDNPSGMPQNEASLSVPITIEY
jgi:hypothetical protein